MWYPFLAVTVICFFNAAFSLRDCDDCTWISECSPAVELIKTDKSNATIQLLRNAICSIPEDGKTFKVCCSDFLQKRFSADDDIQANEHPSLSLLPETCGDFEGNRVVGGTEAGLYEFPWLVLISHQFSGSQNKKFACGGSLISERYVLTAAHCVNNHLVAGVRVGEHDVKKKRDCVGTDKLRICESHYEDIGIEEAIVHEDYIHRPSKRTTLNDIALLRLTRPANFSYPNAGAICLPTTRELQERNIDGELGIVAGWGLMEKSQTSSVVRKVAIPILSANTCSSYYTSNSLNKTLCAGEYGRDSCGGDSGGPLMIPGSYRGSDKFIQYGIVSYGTSQCGYGVPGIYTDVTKYITWILDNMK